MHKMKANNWYTYCFTSAGEYILQRKKSVTDACSSFETVETVVSPKPVEEYCSLK